MAKILFPSDIDWSLGSFANCFQDDSAVRPDYDPTSILSAFLFNNDYTDATGNRTLALNGTISGYPTGLENQGIYLQPGSYLEVDDASVYAPPIWHLISFYAYSLPSNPAPILKSDAYSLEVYTGTLRLRAQTGGGEISLTRGIVTGEWYKVAFWITDTEIGLNVNGNVQTQNISSPNSPTTLQLGGTETNDWDGILDTWFAYSAQPDQSLIDSYMIDGWPPVSSCEWVSPVLAPVMRPLEPDLSFTAVDLGSSSLDAYFRGWSEKPAGNYARITTADGYEVDYSSDASPTGSWIPISQFASYAPRVFQIKLSYTR